MMVQNIQLPVVNSENLSYQFTYPSGLTNLALQSVTTPYGATVSYAYNGPTPNYSFAEDPLFLNSGVSQKIISWTDPSNQTRSQQWTFAKATSPKNSTDAGVLVTAPDGGVTEYDFCSNLPSLSSIANEFCAIYYPNGDYTTQYWQQNCAWGDGSSIYDAGNPFIKYKYRTTAGPLTAVQGFSYDRSGNLTQEQEWDWVSGTLSPGVAPGVSPLRTTQNSYYITPLTTPVIASGTCGNTTQDDANAYWTLAVGPTRDTKTATQVSDSTNTIQRLTQYWYQNQNPSATANVTGQYDWKSRDISGNPVSLPSGQLLTYPPTLAGCTPPGFSNCNASLTQHAYGYGGALVSTTDPDGNVTTYGLSQCPVAASSSTYTIAGTITFPNQSYVTQAFDCPSGLVSGSTDVNRISTSNSYDPIGRLLLAQTGSAQKRDTTNVYNETTCVSPASCGVTTQTPAVFETYRDLNQLNDQSVTDIQTLDQRGQVYLTQNNDIYKQTLPQLGVSPQNFAAVSNPYRSTSESTMGWTRTIYDQMNRPIEVDHFDGGATPAPWGTASAPASFSSISYSGNTTTTTDEAGKARTQTVDGLGRLTCVTEDPGTSPHLNYSTVYTYDVGDNLTSVNQLGNSSCTSTGSAQRTFTYDSLNRLYQAANPESGTTTYAYDPAGNLLTKTNGKGAVTMTYDSMNRVLTKSYSDGTPGVTYCYGGPQSACISGVSTTNAVNRLVQVQSSVSTSQYPNYDEIGDVTNSAQITNGQPYPFTYTYNLLGEITQTIYPMSGRIVNTSYDNAGRAVCVTTQAPAAVCTSTPASTYVNNVVYAPNGAVSTLPMGNGITEGTTFNTRFQPTQIQAGSALTLNYSYGTGTYGTVGDNGNVLGASATRVPPGGGSAQTWTWNSIGYDGVNRLTGLSESGPGSPLSESYGYDSFGNRWMIGSTLPQTVETPPSNVYNAANQIATWSYDAAGNVLGIPATGDSTTRAACASTVAAGTAMLRTACYDLENRMTSETALDGTTSTYAYDGDGRRVQKVTGYGQTSVYVYDAAGQLASELSSVAEPAQTQYLTADALGSTRLVTNASGAQVTCYDFLPFGGDLNGGVDGRGTCFDAFAYPEKSPPDILSLKFTGKERDEESGLDFFGARYFSSAQGRYTTPDEPLADQKANDPQSWNLYAYARSNPLRFLDPTGRECVTLDNGAVGDNGEGQPCQDKSLQTTHGVTVNGTTGQVTSGVFGNAVQMGDIDLSGARDRISGQTAEIVSSATNLKALAGVAKVGLTLGSLALAMAKLTPAEKLIVEELIAAGKTVEAIPTSTGRTADFMVNGVETELKTLESAGPTTLKNAVQNAAKQGQQILIDARKVNISPEEALNQIQRAQGNVGGLQGRVTVLTKGGTVTY